MRYTIVDAQGNNIAGGGGHWVEGAVVSVILDTEQNRAFIQNPSGNPYSIGAATNPNLLDNWYFVDPINQRGQTEYGGTAWAYTIDRWKTRNATDVVAVGDGVTLTDTSGKTAAYLIQPLNNAEHLLGKTITFSVMLGDGSVQYASATLPTANPSGSTAYATTEYSRVVFMQGYWWACLAAAAGTTSSFLAAKLELGSVQTLARLDDTGSWVLNDLPPNKGMEEIACCMCTVDSADPYANNRTTAHAVGAAKIAYGTYVGTGTSGQSNPCTLNFDFKPRVLIVNCTGARVFPQTDIGVTKRDGFYPVGPAIFTCDSDVWTGGIAYVPPQSETDDPAGGTIATTLNFTWGENSVSWYASVESEYFAGRARLAPAQMNGSGETYFYIAFG